MSRRLAVGLVGCGTIGTELAIALRKTFRRNARLIGLYDQDSARAERLARRFQPAIPILNLQRLIQRSQLVIEAASAQALGQILPAAIRGRKQVMVMSTGGLLRHRKLVAQAAECKVPLILPSGALVGLDGIKGAAVGKLKKVTLTTSKPPAAFSGVAEVARRKIRLAALRRPTVLFQGTAAQAAARFPKNANVAATLALAGLGPIQTQVRIVADPKLTINVHEVVAVGTFGRCITRTENRSSRTNPKTSQLAVDSAVATLKQLLEPLKVGT